ncbi:MAG: bile acid:sodium symporter [Thermodesulfobacteriota bacterium]
MLRTNDLLLLAVLSVSMAVGVLAPETGRPSQPFIIHLVMLLLFLSFLSIKLADVKNVVRVSWPRLVFLTFIKLILLPAGAYLVFRAVWPEFAVAVLLLTGISTGVVAPFISNLVGGNSALVLALVVVTSLLAPFSLPALVEALAGRTLEIPFTSMVRMLAQVIFIPLAAGAALRRLAPGAAAGLLKRGFPLSLACFAVINLGVFSRYADFFRQRPAMVLAALAVAVVLAGFNVAAGLAVTRKMVLADRLGAAVSLSNMNNVLVIVFAARFFGALEPTLAAVYMFPFFGVIVPLRIISRRARAGEREV